MFKVMDHFDDCRDEEWEDLKLGSKSNMGNPLSYEYREIFMHLLHEKRTETCEPGKTFILNFKHNDIIGQAKFTWFRYRVPMREMMRFLAENVLKCNDNWRDWEIENDNKSDDFEMSDYFFFLPFETFSPNFAELRKSTKKSMDEYGCFVQDCWLKALAGCLKYKKLKDEIHEYFYSHD